MRGALTDTVGWPGGSAFNNWGAPKGVPMTMQNLMPAPIPIAPGVQLGGIYPSIQMQTPGQMPVGLVGSLAAGYLGQGGVPMHMQGVATGIMNGQPPPQHQPQQHKPSMHSHGAPQQAHAHQHLQQDHPPEQAPQQPATNGQTMDWPAQLASPKNATLSPMSAALQQMGSSSSGLQQQVPGWGSSGIWTLPGSTPRGANFGWNPPYSGGFSYGNSLQGASPIAGD
jgi:hypothetical protein